MAEKKAMEQEENLAPEYVEIEYNGSKFRLEFDRDSVRRTETMFDISPQDLFSGKVTVMQAVFQGAFIKNHPNAKTTTINGLWSSITDKTGLYEALVAMYYSTVSELLEEPEEGKAVSWKAVR